MFTFKKYFNNHFYYCFGWPGLMHNSAGAGTYAVPALTCCTTSTAQGCNVLRKIEQYIQWLANHKCLRPPE